MKALIVVDVQYDFLPGGSLEVPGGDKILPVVNKMIDNFGFVVATKDWHPEDHGSFASNHEGKKPGEKIELDGLEQILWPPHCIQGTPGAEFSDKLDTSQFKKVFVKGTNSRIDSYSGFYDNGHKKSTGLAEYLKENDVDEVYVVGLAGDVCVKFTALDAVREGFDTYLVLDGTKPVNVEADDFEKALREMKEKGVVVVESKDILSEAK